MQLFNLRSLSSTEGATEEVYCESLFNGLKFALQVPHMKKEAFATVSQQVLQAKIVRLITHQAFHKMHHAVIS